ncbi:hypothetical protein RJT34_28879 [Clitoria ternatea]|uniref:Uncharacterized protein n=1 Tax=Clitoria ternatea TaxID=43366 RepID=A0AAN9ICU4_CLITE
MVDERGSFVSEKQHLTVAAAHGSIINHQTSFTDETRLQLSAPLRRVDKLISTASPCWRARCCTTVLEMMDQGRKVFTVDLLERYAAKGHGVISCIAAGNDVIVIGTSRGWVIRHDFGVGDSYVQFFCLLCSVHLDTQIPHFH